VQRLVYHLSVYLGHARLAHTQVYLTLTPEVLQQAGTRFERYRGLRLVVRSQNITRRNLHSVSCPAHGRLLASWTAVLPATVAARDGRVRQLRLPPVVMRRKARVCAGLPPE